MRDRLKAFGGLATHTLRWRIGRDELGIGCFQALEFVIQGIVFGVADARTVLDVILMLMQMNRLTQLVQTLRDHSEVFHKVSLVLYVVNTLQVRHAANEPGKPGSTPPNWRGA